MGTFVGHVAPGFGFVLIGLWHLYNNIKLHILHPNSYTSSPWFRAPFAKYLELYLIIGGSSLSIAMELFIGPVKHQPFDHDGTIPSNHLHNFEHSSISLSFLIYATLALLLDRNGLKVEENIEEAKSSRDGITQMLAALAFCQQFLMFHLHSSDHMGVEGQYHLLLQIVIFVSIATTLIGIALPRSFTLSFVRSLSIFFQGIWLMVMGFMLWTPQLIPKGCHMNMEEGHYVVRCNDDHTLHRAKSLVNLEFSWFVSGVAMFGAFFYLALEKKFIGNVKYYRALEEVAEVEEMEDVESQKNVRGEFQSLIQTGKGLQPVDMER
ncbi:hypothetical protein GIB67_010424 [Kingdonia uniflora]|uniref:Uncharacterized protein n=1 Tax=Kingdonia uniflora TaxID=39325 RepID=A0A7J7MAQ1_9MAGN|nr:hypothetical protein GIB67_010424 [Kingdonia uniflora]